MKKDALLFFAVILLSGYSSAQEPVFPNLSGYKIKTGYPVFTAENLWDYIDGAADKYLEYGFADLHVAEYKKGRSVIKCEIYRLSDHTMAFGIYSSERSPSFRFLNLGAQGYITDGAVNFFKGSYYIKIRTYSKKEKVLRAEETLAQKVEVMLTGESLMPSMLDQFPAEGKKLNEEVFISKNVLGHSFLAKAFRTPYQYGNDSFSIYISESATPEDANKTAQTYIASTGIDPVETSDNRFVLSDGYNGTIFLAWKDRRIVIISGLAKDQSELADRYTSEILR